MTSGEDRPSPSGRLETVPVGSGGAVPVGTCPAHGLGSTCVPERVERPPADSGVQPPFCALRRGRGRARRTRSPKHHLAGDGAEMPAMPGHVRTAGMGNTCDLLPRRARGRLCPVHRGAAWAAVAYVWGGRWTFSPSAGRWPVNGLTRGPSMQHVGVLTPRTSEHGWMWRWVFTEGAKL